MIINYTGGYADPPLQEEIEGMVSLYNPHLASPYYGEGLE
jgi:hypothetical protein